jgi:hypothetical protein
MADKYLKVSKKRMKIFFEIKWTKINGKVF